MAASRLPSVRRAGKKGGKRIPRTLWWLAVWLPPAVFRTYPFFRIGRSHSGRRTSSGGRPEIAVAWPCALRPERLPRANLGGCHELHGPGRRRTGAADPGRPAAPPLLWLSGPRSPLPCRDSSSHPAPQRFVREGPPVRMPHDRRSVTFRCHEAPCVPGSTMHRSSRRQFTLVIFGRKLGTLTVHSPHARRGSARHTRASAPWSPRRQPAEA
jgi:hypothetical protein